MLADRSNGKLLSSVSPFNGEQLPELLDPIRSMVGTRALCVT